MSQVYTASHPMRTPLHASNPLLPKHDLALSKFGFMVMMSGRCGDDEPKVHEADR